MRLELLGAPLCRYVHRTAILLHEKGLPFERRQVDLVTKPEWFLALSPRGKVPVLLVDGRPLFESPAINEFVDEVHGDRLLPDDPFERALHRAWLEIASDLFGAQYVLFHAKTAEEVEQARVAVEPLLARFEDALSTGLVEDGGFGLLHAAVAPALHRFVLMEEHRGARFLKGVPRLDAWARRLAARPSVVDTVVDACAARWLQSLADGGSHIARGGARGLTSRSATASQ